MFIAGAAGRIEAVVDEPTVAARAAVVLAPPHPDLGGTMFSKVVHEAARGFARVGCVALRFNYRGTGLSEGQFDGGLSESDDMTVLLDYLEEKYEAPLWVAGYAFGAWVAVSPAALDARVRLYLAIAPAVDDYDFSTLAAAGKPVFIVHGSDDELYPLSSTRRLYGSLDEPRELAIVDGANHVFEGHTAEVGEAIQDLLLDFST